MPLSHHYSFSPLGDSALLIDFGNKMNVPVSEIILDLFDHLVKNRFEGIIDIVPAYSSLAVFYDTVFFSEYRDKEKTVFETVVEKINEQIIHADESEVHSPRKIKVPFCYCEEFAYDLSFIAKEKSLTTQEFIDVFLSRPYRVYMVGFLPGFAYMGQVDKRIATPRKHDPRKLVPAGSIGIAGKQTGIYPVDSPGGWQIIGRTPLPLFNKNSTDPVLFQPGDEVTFYPISSNEFENYKNGNF
jgi:inhibitor of KinA